MDKHRRDLLEAAGNPYMFVQGPSKDEEVEIRARSWVPSQNVKEESIMPKLEYPSLPVSPDPNNYCWGSKGIWNRELYSTSLSSGHLASASVSLFQLQQHIQSATRILDSYDVLRGEFVSLNAQVTQMQISLL